MCFKTNMNIGLGMMDDVFVLFFSKVLCYACSLVCKSFFV